jgi:hypothetical protein
MQRSGSPSRKLDYKRELREFFGIRAVAPVIVDVPELSFLMVDGTGDPNMSRGYREGVEALFAVSYRVKFAVKRGSEGIDYSVMPLEGLWWVDDMSTFSLKDKSSWSWTAMIMPARCGHRRSRPAIDPGSLEEEEVSGRDEAALRPLGGRPGGAGPSHRSIQRRGAIDRAAPRLHRGDRASSSGKHHEIYLNDPSRSDPAKLTTIIRQPIASIP